MITIGPSFASEVIAAGLGGKPFTWTEYGILNAEALSEEDRDKLEAVLAAHDPLPSILTAYAEAKHARVLNGGIRVDVGGGEMADVSSDVNGRGLVSGCVGLIDLAEKVGAPAPTFPWVNNDGTKLTLTATQIETIALALGQFVQANYGALGGVLADIADGTITTEAEIDAAPWPANG